MLGRSIGCYVKGRRPALRCASTKVKEIFDRGLKQRQRMAVAHLPEQDYYEYLRTEVTNRLVDRLEDITKTFPVTLELDHVSDAFVNNIASANSLKSDSGGIGGIEKLVQCKIGGSTPQFSEQLTLEAALQGPQTRNVNGRVLTASVSGAAEQSLPFTSDSFDLVVNNMSLHWINDIPGALSEVQRVLKPDGAFVGAMLGGNSLQELKYAFFLADQERKGALGQHVSPMAKASDMAGLMQGANFSLPTVDVDTIQVEYPDLFSLMDHLYRMGESSAAFHREMSVGKDTMLAAAAIYQELYGTEDGSIPATFEVIYMIGWKPHASQPKACRRGSADTSLKDLKIIK